VDRGLHGRGDGCTLVDGPHGLRDIQPPHGSLFLSCRLSDQARKRMLNICNLRP
jgi:hypothetical protein